MSGMKNTFRLRLILPPLRQYSNRFLCGKNKPSLTVGHTGQRFQDDDHRNVRFQEYKKIINENIATDLISKVPVIMVKAKRAVCDGGGAMGHPKVYLNLDDGNDKICGYCGLRYRTLI